MNAIREFFVRHFTPNHWETVWVSRCTTRAVSLLAGDYGRVEALAKIQVERRKNLARGLLCAMGQSVTYPIDEIAVGNPGAIEVCRRERITM